MLKSIITSFVILCYIQAVGQSLVHLHTNKQTYTSGEKIWMSAYLTDSTSGRLLSETHPLYVQMFAANGSLQATERLYTLHGRGSGFLLIKPTLTGGVYRLRAFTKTMLKQRRFYQKYITVQHPRDSVSFFINTPVVQHTPAPNGLTLKLLPNKYVFDKRERVDLLLRVEDANGKPQIGTFSLSVADLRVASGQENHTLLTSCPIPAMPDTTKQDQPEAIVYRGEVINQKTGQGIVNADVIVMSLDSAQRFTRVVKTDSNGHFVINNLVVEGTRAMQCQVNNKRGQPIANAEIRWEVFPPVGLLPPLTTEYLPINTYQKEQMAQLRQKPDGEQNPDWGDGIVLKEVAITGKKNDEINTTGMIKLHSEANFKVDFDPDKPLNMNIYDMMRMLPGVSVISLDVSSFAVRIRGIGSLNENDPLFLVDGMPVRDISFVNSNDIIRMEVLSGANAAIYGSSAGNGVIAIYTRRFRTIDASKIPSQTKAYQLEGYQAYKSFFSPDYGQSSDQKEPDYRQTLYWNPELTTDTNGEVWVSFYTSDVSSNFQVMVEGTTQQQRGVATKMIRVK
jgi:TonB-dependent Receptor Plug Domain